ncbi:MAG: hypothetical protein QOD99_2870 [Chthoniobacter sp.]|jgi:hypothetical protein|nr:hypothetical protein [Chthoniobacter sp.]
MPRPKKNKGFQEGKRLWHWDILFTFIEDHPIPESWGRSSFERCENAVWLVRIAISPCELTEIPDAQLQEVFARRFTRLFIKAPAYFLALVSFAREKVASFAQIEKVATLLLDQFHHLPRMRDGQLSSDKEIAAFFEQQRVGGLDGLHPSIIGKARDLLSRREKRRSQKYDAMNAEYQAERRNAVEAYKAMITTPEFRAWYRKLQAEERKLTPIQRLGRKPSKTADFGPYDVSAEKNEKLAKKHFLHYMAGRKEFRPHETEESPAPSKGMTSPRPRSY